MHIFIHFTNRGLEQVCRCEFDKIAIIGVSSIYFLTFQQLVEVRNKKNILKQSLTSTMTIIIHLCEIELSMS
jgi:hypothetical protein